MFWLGIALVIIGVYIMTKAFYDLGYNAGFTDGKKAVRCDSSLRTFDGSGWRTIRKDTTTIHTTNTLKPKQEQP